MPSVLTHGSLFAGIGGFDLGFEMAGFKTIWQVEIEPFCRCFLQTRFPKAQRFEDIRQCGARNLTRVDCITAGIPCQDVSIAGHRAGLKGKRTGLFYHFARILRELRPAWFVFENVPGLFSSNQGRDLAEILRVLMAKCRYGVSWRVLDSQFFGVAQRRRRVFIVGCLGRPCPTEVLFEPDSSTRNFAAIGEARQYVATSITTSTERVGSRGGGDGTNLVNSIRSKWAKGTSGPAGDECDNLIATTLSAGSHDQSNAPSRRREDDFNLVATLSSDGTSGGFHTEPGEHICVRAPVDSDRMRDFARLPKGLDSARYRALGNAVTVQVAEWIARRIKAKE